MTRDEIKLIAGIVGGDDTYRHFIHRINKEFEAAEQDHNSRVKVIVKRNETDQEIGFCLLGESPSKMKVWQRMLISEGWVDKTFSIDPTSFELMYMYIRPEFRSKGYGRMLLDKAQSFARSEGARQLYAYVSDSTDESLKFYEKALAEVIYKFTDEDASTAFVRWQLSK